MDWTHENNGYLVKRIYWNLSGNTGRGREQRLWGPNEYGILVREGGTGWR